MKSSSLLTLKAEDACILFKVAVNWLSRFMVEYFGRIALMLMHDSRLLSRQKRGVVQSVAA